MRMSKTAVITAQEIARQLEETKREVAEAFFVVLPPERMLSTAQTIFLEARLRSEAKRRAALKGKPV